MVFFGLGTGQVQHQESAGRQEIRATVSSSFVAGVTAAEKTSALVPSDGPRGIRAALLLGQLLRRRAVDYPGQTFLAAPAAHHQVRRISGSAQRDPRGAAPAGPRLRLAPGKTCLPKRPRQRHHPQVALYAQVRKIFTHQLLII